MAFPSTGNTCFHDSKQSYSDQVESEICSRLSMRTKGEDIKMSSEDTVQNGIATTSTPYKRLRVVDESLLSPEEADILLEKRAYNRDSAKRARYRRKQLIEDLNKRVRELEQDKTELRSSLNQMKKINETLDAKNQELLIKVSQLRADTTLSLGSIGRARFSTTIPNSPIELAPSFDQHPATLAAAAALMNPSPSSLSASLEYFKYLHDM